MKDFIKWLGVNEKVAKVVVWLMIIMLMLILTNTMLESTGFPNYKITYDNLKNIKPNFLIDCIINWVVILLSFYSVVLLVFRVTETKKIFKYALLYLVLNVLLTYITSSAFMQIFILMYTSLFCYFYSRRKTKYIFYGILASIATAAIQGVWYMSKARFIDYTDLSDMTKSLLSLDYFIIMAIIILVKEIYLKKRSEKICLAKEHAGSGSANSKTKTNSQRKSQKK